MLLNSVAFLLIFCLNDPSIINSGIFLYCFYFSLRSVNVGFVYLHFLMLGAYIEYICNNMGYRFFVELFNHYVSCDGFGLTSLWPDFAFF